MTALLVVGVLPRHRAQGAHRTSTPTRGSRSPTGRRSYEEKLAAYRGLADDYFDTERYRDFCASALPNIDDIVHEWVDSPDFRNLLTETIQTTYPKHEWDKFEGHFGGLTRMWVKDEQSRLGTGTSATDETAIGGPAPALTD